MAIVSALALMFFVMVFSEPQIEDRIILIPDADGKVGEILVSNEAGSHRVNQAYMSVEVNKESHIEAPKQLSKERVNQEFSGVFAAVPQPPSRYMLYFVSATTELTDASQKLLPKITKDVKSRDVYDVFIDGHTDTLGDAEKNYLLALKRAQAVNKLFTDKFSKPEKVQVSSHGESNLLIMTADNVDEPRNRRVEIVIH